MMRWRLGGIGGAGDGLDGVGFSEFLTPADFASACPLLIDESLCAPIGEEAKDCGSYSLLGLDVPRDSPR